MFRTRLLKQIEDWKARGLVDAMLADRLSADARARHSSFSFASVLGLLAALLLGAAILTFIAANWEQVPRLARLAMLGAVIAAGPVLGAFFAGRGAPLVGEGARLVGAAAYGAGIALVSQMYHISGDEASAILYWYGGVAIAAALTRSAALTIASIVLAAVYLAMKTRWFGFSVGFPYWYPVLLAIAWGLSLWTESIAARRLAVLALIHFGLHVWLDSLDGPAFMVAVAMAALSALVFLASALRPAETEKVLQLGSATGFLALVGFATAVGLLHWHVGDDLGGMLVVGVVGLGGAVGALWLSGAHDRAVRIGAYVLFTVEMLMVYFITVGSLIGTAAFFLTAGVVLALAAFFILRIEKRVASRAAEAGS